MPHPTSSLRERRKVVFATVIGTTIEWYDFFLYGSAAGLVFTHIFFAPAGPTLASLLAFVTVGISFLFRPLGAFLAGHFGDRYGRKIVLTTTLIMMGLATALMGLIPSYESIGIAAPILIILLRILQGISAGGEWGGAALLAVEHAPAHKRGFFGAGPQVGVPLGLLLASAVLAILTSIAPGDAFLVWGWRIGFLLSAVLVIIGYFIRRTVEESPVFTELTELREHSSSPISVVFKKHWRLVITAALILVANQSVGYMTTGGYIQRYASAADGPIGLPAGHVLWVVTGSAVTWLAFTIIGGYLSDIIGRKRTFLIGWTLLMIAVIALFPLVNAATVASLAAGLIALTIGLGLTYGPISALYAEAFPPQVRFSGVSVAYALGAIIGGAFAPTIAQYLVQSTGTTWSITIYLAITVIISVTATIAIKERSGASLTESHTPAAVPA